MALSNPTILYGIHSIAPYNRVSKLPYGILKVIGSANLALTTEMEQLYAGASKFAFAAETKTVATEFTAKVKAYPGFLFELFLGATVTAATADTAGTISTAANGLGTSVIAATGIASIAILAASKANLKFGKYVVKATTTTAVKIYSLSDIDHARGTDAVYVDDTLEISGPHTITTAGVETEVADLGIKFVGGASAIAMVVGDTAYFEIKPPSTKSSEIIVGKATSTMPDFGAMLYAQKRATGEMFEIDAHNCVGGGLPIGLEEQAFSQPELKMTCLYDTTLDRVFTMRHILPS